MSSLSNYMEKILLDYGFGGDAWDPPLVIAVGLTTEPIDGEVMHDTEANIHEIEPPLEAGYERQEFDNTPGNWGETTFQIPDIEGIDHEIAHKALSVNITFPAPTGDWGTVTHFFLAIGGTEQDTGVMVGYGELPEPVEVNEGDEESVKIGSGELVVTLD